MNHSNHHLPIHRPWLPLASVDPEIHTLMDAELHRQQDGLEMIASENFLHPALLAAMGNVFCNKYAEGLPHKRYYGGCEVVDQMEMIAIQRATTLFGCEFANVQPHSGASANAAVMMALLKPGDTILGLDLMHGGHLTHGSKVNFSGQLYRSEFYTLNPITERIDLDALRSQALKLKPKLIIAGASAYPRMIDFAAFRQIADQVGAYLLVDMAHIAGLVAAGVHPSPFPHAHVVTSTSHKTLRGPRGGFILWNDPELTPAINKGVFPGLQGGPLEHLIAIKASCFLLAGRADFKTLQQQTITNAQIFAKQLQNSGLQVVTQGTDNHIVLLSLADHPYTGKDLEHALTQVGITVNKNTIPGDQRSPFLTSGVRFGTPAITTRGMGITEMTQIAHIVHQICQYLTTTHHSPSPDQHLIHSLKQQVLTLSQAFPLYQSYSESE